MDSRPIKALLSLLEATSLPVRRISVTPEGQVSVDLFDRREAAPEKPATKDDSKVEEKPRKRLSEMIREIPPPFDFGVAQ